MNDDSERLTGAERAIAALVATGHTNEEIAPRRETAARWVPIKVIAIDLGLAPHTIAARSKRCADKLGMGSRLTQISACGRAAHDPYDRGTSTRG